MTKYPMNTPKCDLTVAELREQFTADHGHVHPMFDVPWPTIEDAKERLEWGFVLFGATRSEHGGRVGMLQSLKGAIAFLRASIPVSDLALLDPLDELYRVLADLDVSGNSARPCR